MLTFSIRRLLPLVLLAGLASCDNLQQDIDVVIPDGPAQLVVECYLEPNQRAQLTVSETAPYLSSPIPVVPEDVTVVIAGPNRQRETLLYDPGFNFVTGKVYTHRGRNRLLIQPGDVFTLEAKDKKGRVVTGTAKMPTPCHSIRLSSTSTTGRLSCGRPLCWLVSATRWKRSTSTASRFTATVFPKTRR
ncbi:DUF4249 family protein [Hymenobacter qilianensis]|uniref:DUF4249 family protein n=1 Tax=Hymenobacter qilianensis TaxID=1385715 RepID=A0A7H0GW16_9BACT|nr:DUF4249 family protein [Hymenobacter qilianensis]QNP52482.1 DUF4249 family protein [Hymenobacter qilianensis]